MMLVDLILKFEIVAYVRVSEDVSCGMPFEKSRLLMRHRFGNHTNDDGLF